MLNIVRERFLRCAERHSRESKLWSTIADNCLKKNDWFGVDYATKKMSEHNRMAAYWIMAIRDIRYKPGTWAYTF